MNLVWFMWSMCIINWADHFRLQAVQPFSFPRFNSSTTGLQKNSMAFRRSYDPTAPAIRYHHFPYQIETECRKKNVENSFLAQNYSHFMKKPWESWQSTRKRVIFAGFFEYPLTDFSGTLLQIKGLGSTRVLSGRQRGSHFVPKLTFNHWFGETFSHQQIIRGKAKGFSCKQIDSVLFLL